MSIAIEHDTVSPEARAPGAASTEAGRDTPVLDVVIPVYNEQAALAGSVRRLHGHLREHFPFTFRITIADNASVDATAVMAARLADEIAELRMCRLECKGRGRALRTVWAESDAPVLAYMDVDLSTRVVGIAAAGRTDHLGTLPRRDRHATIPLLPGGARTQTGSSRAATT